MRASRWAVCAALVAAASGLWWLTASDDGDAALSFDDVSSAGAARGDPALSPPLLASVPLQPREVASTERVEAAACEVPAASVLRGVLVDDRTGEVLPFFRVDVRRKRGRPPLEVWSDANGRFETSLALEHDHYRLMFVDHPDLPSQKWLGETIRHDSPEERTLELFVGPTYRIVTQLPPDVTREDAPPGALRAHAARARWGVGRARFRLTLQSLHPSSLGHLNPWEFTPLRTDHGAWCRFREIPVGFGGPWSLRLETEDGFWSGEARVDSVVGVYPRPVSIDVVHHGGLKLRVTDGQREKVSGVEVMLEGDGGSWYDINDDTVHSARVRERRGASRAEWLQPPHLPAGPYTLTVGSPLRVRLAREKRSPPLTVRSPPSVRLPALVCAVAEVSMYPKASTPSSLAAFNE